MSMATIDNTSAKILAALILDDLRDGYIKNHLAEYTAFLDEQAAKVVQPMPIKRRQSRKVANNKTGKLLPDSPKDCIPRTS